MPYKFNAISGLFDYYETVSGGSSIPGMSANEVLYMDSSATLAGDASFKYFDTFSAGGGVDEAGLELTQSVLRTVDVGTVTSLTRSTLTVTDDFIPTNDGSSEYAVNRNVLKVNGSVDNTAFSIASVSYYSQFNQIYNNGIFEVKGSADTSVVLCCSYNYTNPTQVIVPTDGDSPNILVYGAINQAAAQITVNSPATPYLQYIGTYSYAIRGGGATPNLCIGGDFMSSGGTLDYGVRSQGTTAAFSAVGHYLPASNNLYDLGSSSLRIRKLWSVDADLSGSLVLSAVTANRILYTTIGGTVTNSANLTFNGTLITMPNATSTTSGIQIGSTGVIYQSTALSGSGTTLINAVIREHNANFTVNAPVMTNISVNENALLVQKQANWTSAATSRCWGLNFNVSSNGSAASSDGTSGLVGVEGTVSFTPSVAATMAAMSGAIFFNAINDNATVTRFAAADGYGPDVTGSVTGGICTEGTAIVARLGRAAGRGTINVNYGVQIRNATVSGTGAITTQVGIQGNGMAAITAASQVRRFIEIPQMPSPGAFLGVTVYAIDILGTSRLARDGIRFAADTELYSYAANVLSSGIGDALRSDTSVQTTLLRPHTTAGGGTTFPLTVRGRDTGDDFTAGGAGTDLTIRGGDGSTGKPTGAGGNLIFRLSNGAPGGTIKFYEIDGTSEIFGLTEGVGAVFNEGGDSLIDFRVEGDTLSSCFFLDASADSIQMFGASASFGGGVGVLGITNAVTVPSSNPTGGGVLYAEAGALKWRGSSGTVTTMAPA